MLAFCYCRYVFLYYIFYIFPAIYHERQTCFRIEARQELRLLLVLCSHL